MIDRTASAPEKTGVIGASRDGAVRRRLAQRQQGRVMDAVRRVGKLVDLLEIGCGDKPASFLLPLCRTYTGCDYSTRRLEVARAALVGVTTPVDIVQADACSLPFEDQRFGAVFSAHMLYQIEERDAQAAALREMVRVLEPGGALVLVTANPRPLLFPVRALGRVVADSPLMSVIDRIRPLPFFPYRPMRVTWITDRLREAGLHAHVRACGVASVELERRVADDHGMGRLLWRGIDYLDAHHPELAARLGCFVVITAIRPRAPASDGAARSRAETLVESFSSPVPAHAAAAVQLATATSGDGDV